MTYITKLGAYPCFQASGRRIQHFPFNNADQPVCFDAFFGPLVTNKSFKIRSNKLLKTDEAGRRADPGGSSSGGEDEGQTEVCSA